MGLGEILLKNHKRKKTIVLKDRMTLEGVGMPLIYVRAALLEEMAVECDERGSSYAQAFNSVSRHFVWLGVLDRLTCLN